MRRCVLLFVGLLFCHAIGSAQPGGREANSSNVQQDEMMVLAEDLKWRPAPAKLPAGAQFARLTGDPSKPGSLYTFRVKLPDGYSVPPHTHPVDEHITVIQGTILLGMGQKFDRGKLRELSAGSYARLPKGKPHFNLYQGETVVQFHGIGPYDIDYIDPADDPRHQRGR